MGKRIIQRRRSKGLGRGGEIWQNGRFCRKLSDLDFEIEFCKNKGSLPFDQFQNARVMFIGAEEDRIINASISKCSELNFFPGLNNGKVSVKPILQSIKTLYLEGHDFPWDLINSYGNRIRLPLYPFKPILCLPHISPFIRESEIQKGSPRQDAINKNSNLGSDAECSNPMPSVNRKEKDISKPIRTDLIEAKRVVAMRIWKTLLRLDSLKETDDFFDVGGDSTLAVKVALLISKKLNIEVPPLSLFYYPVFQNFIKSVLEEKNKNLLIKDGLPVLFWAHGGFEKIHRFLPENQPRYLFESYWSKQPEKVKPSESIEDMATSIISSIKSIDVFGNYALCGYSIGALIMLEVGCQLQKKKISNSILFLLDPVLPRNLLQKKNPHMDLKEQSSIDPSPKNLHDRVEKANLTLSLKHRIRSISMTIQRNIRNEKAKKLISNQKILPSDLRRTFAYCTYQKALKNYHPKPYRGKTIIILRRENGINLKKKWQEIIPHAEFHCLDTENHFEVVKDPYTDIWGPLLADFLNQNYQRNP